MSSCRLVLIFNCDAGILGHIRYGAAYLKHMKSPCGLCTITYDGLNESNAWQAVKKRARIDIESIYRNQMDDAMKAVASGEFPCGLLHRDGDYSLVLRAADFDHCLERTDPIGCLEEKIDSIATQNS